MLSDAVQNVEWIDSHVCFRVRETNEGIVEEYIEPLLVKLLLLPYQVSLACIYDLIIGNVVL